jgi:SAM-dependent methyltransferase
MSERIASCDLCGNTVFRETYRKPDEYYHPDEYFSVVECKQCGLGFVNPRPSVSEIIRYYPPAFYENFEREREYHEERYAREARYVERHMKPAAGRMMLDVGSANGGFPVFMNKRGWQVECVEPFGNCEARDVTVFKTAFQDIPVNEPKYDVVTMWAVLEHVHHPSIYFNKASKVLKTGGVLISLVTNFESLASKRLYAEDVPRHLYFFTRKTFEEYSSRAGMRLEHAYFRKDIYRMLPTNVLFYLRARMLGREFLYKDMVRGIGAPTVLGKVRNLLRSPLIAIDGMMARILEQVEMLAGRYGIVTYVVRKL